MAKPPVRNANVSSNVDTIALPAGTYTLTITGNDDTSNYGDLDITQPATLLGAGANVTTIKGNSGWTDRILHVRNSTVTISGVTITGGNYNSGGGLRNENSNLTVNNSAIVSNTVPTGTGGGLYSNSALTLTNVSVLSNTAGTYGVVFASWVAHTTSSVPPSVATRLKKRLGAFTSRQVR